MGLKEYVRLKKKVDILEKGLKIMDRILSHSSPADLLKIIFTPENVRALGEGFAIGLVKGAKDKD